MISLPLKGQEFSGNEVVEVDAVDVMTIRWKREKNGRDIAIPPHVTRNGRVGGTTQHRTNFWKETKKAFPACGFERFRKV